jgi:hypothetical protein
MEQNAEGVSVSSGTQMPNLFDLSCLHKILVGRPTKRDGLGNAKITITGLRLGHSTIEPSSQHTISENYKFSSLLFLNVNLFLFSLTTITLLPPLFILRCQNEERFIESTACVTKNEAKGGC